jgi:type I restriction enzyme S subunit
LGDVGRLTTDEQVFLGQRLFHYRANPESLDSRFLAYVLQSNQVQGWIKGVGFGATVVHAKVADFLKIPIPIPPMPTQVRIGEILSAYDDLIENNWRRIALLEESARQLYREWFVRFRFPGHEHVKIIDGVPEGWERTPASNVLNVLSGGTPNTNTPRYWDGDIGFFTPKDAVPSAYVSITEKTITEAGLTNCNSKLYPKDTLFITARGTVGKMNLAQVPMAMNQSCYALVSNTFLSQRFLYLTMDDSLQQLRSQASGAVFAAIIVSTFDRILVTKPDEKIATAFDDFVNPIFDHIAILGRQTEQLAKARDLLLPRLMSGSLAA